jgi:hypothetical protein
MIRYIFLIAAVTFLSGVSIANNIQVSAPTLTGENRTDGYVYVTFDLSWANSWRGTEANNWDAAWVFVKYRVGAGEWKHAKLHNSGHIVGSGTPATLDVGLRDDKSPFEPAGNPGVGAFIYRSAEGFGTFNTTANKLRWNYTAEGITTGATVEVRVFAIEMVYVREGEFNVGGGGGFYNAFNSTTINTPDARVMPSGIGSLGGMAGGYPSGIDGGSNEVQPFYSDWPNGYDAFYCMKYEASQQQFADFYNTLRLDQVNSIRYPGTGQNRYMITQDNPGSITTGMPNVACNFIDPYAGFVYSDWACLRIMTELEYEKACRGPLPPVVGEYSWGTTNVVGGAGFNAPINPYVLTYEGIESEAISTYYSPYLGNTNHLYTSGIFAGTTPGPFRVGIFAANGANIGRVSSGSSYWGIMELTGNLSEICITLGKNNGKKFRNNNGDGDLNTVGISSDSSWSVNDATMIKGGHFAEWIGYFKVSDRVSNSYDSSTLGFRAVRSRSSQ